MCEGHLQRRPLSAVWVCLCAIICSFVRLWCHQLQLLPAAAAGSCSWNLLLRQQFASLCTASLTVGSSASYCRWQILCFVLLTTAESARFHCRLLPAAAAAAALSVSARMHRSAQRTQHALIGAATVPVVRTIMLLEQLQQPCCTVILRLGFLGRYGW